MTRTPIDREQPVVIAGLVVPGLGENDALTHARIEESQGLVEALGVKLGFSTQFKVREPNAAQLFGSGQLDAIADMAEEAKASMVVIDCSLSPVQQRNLEKKLAVKIVDRTGLILEIFGLRARTAEGRLQVEMARILYERSRLVRTWTHLERQRGGRGFLAGPGESQLEADRRMLDRQIGRLKSSLEDVRRTRGIQRAGRRKRGKPIIALVGYTNAGKSTLFNRLTSSNVFSADMPFATLDPTVRDVTLPSGDDVSLIDTVGFITDLPTTLVDSFRATIEEAMEADLLLHVRDISHEESDRQAEDVETVLNQLERSSGHEHPAVVEVWNKSDLLNDEMRLVANARAQRREDVVLVSAASGQGFADLLDVIQEHAFDSRTTISVTLKPKDGKARAWLYDRGDVQNETVGSNGDVVLVVDLDLADKDRFVRLFDHLSVAVVANVVESQS